MVERGVQMASCQLFTVTKKCFFIVFFQVCAYMPSTVAERCEEFVDEYGDELIRIIVETELDPKQFCAEMGACKANSVYGR